MDLDESAFAPDYDHREGVREALAAWAERRGREPRRGPGRFSTRAAVAWGRRLGWRLIDRERYDARTRRHRDLMLGADVLFEDADGLVLVQAAGRGQRAAHRRRFDDAGGADRAAKLGMRFLYVVFDRGEPEPLEVERWA
jgi:hypothetical protein